MSRVDDLIRELAPNGVPYRPLGAVGEFVRGNGLQKSELTESGFPAIHYGQIHTHYGVWATSTKSFTTPERAAKLRRAQPGDLIIATTSEDDESVGKATAWLGDGEAAISGDAYIYRHRLEPRFVSYFFKSDHFRRQKSQGLTGTKVRRISGDSLARMKIPEPPLEVQREIGRILDHFTELEAELEAELQAELQARRKQHEVLQQRILAGLVAKSPSLIELRDVGEWFGGGTPSKANAEFWADGTIPWISPKDMKVSTVLDTEDYITLAAIKKSATRLVPGGSIALVTRSSILEHTLPVAYVPMPAALNQDMKAVVPVEGISVDYLFRVLQACRSELLSFARRDGASVASLDSSLLFRYSLPLPDAATQDRAVKEFAALDETLSPLRSGISAELAARRKQYEYYRDKLLTFEEAPA